MHLGDGNIDTSVQEVVGLIKAFGRNIIVESDQSRCLVAKLPTSHTSWDWYDMLLGIPMHLTASLRFSLARILTELNGAKTLLNVARMRVAITNLQDVFDE